MGQEYNAAGRMSPDFHANLAGAERVAARSPQAPDGCARAERLTQKFCHAPGCSGQNKVRFTL